MAKKVLTVKKSVPQKPTYEKLMADVEHHNPEFVRWLKLKKPPRHESKKK